MVLYDLDSSKVENPAFLPCQKLPEYVTLREGDDRRISGWKYIESQVTPPTEILRGVYPERSVRAQDNKYTFSESETLILQPRHSRKGGNPAPLHRHSGESRNPVLGRCGTAGFSSQVQEHCY